MITATSLQHPTIQASIHKALLEATQSSLENRGGQAYVLNRKGKAIFRVKHTRGIGGGFEYHAGNNNLKNTLIKALRRA